MALLAAEFRRLCPPGRDYLVLPELLQFSAQDATLLIEPTHLGALWALDRCGQTGRGRPNRPSDRSDLTSRIVRLSHTQRSRRSCYPG